MELKTKLKAKSAVLPLFWQSTYEFVAPYDFDECILRINALGAKHKDKHSLFIKIHAPDVELASLQDNGGVCNFKMNSHVSSTLFVAQARGQLIYGNDSQACVNVQIGFSWWSTLRLIAFLPIICAMIFVITHPISRPEITVSLVIAVILYSLILLPSIFTGYVLKAELYRDIQDALMKDTPPIETIAN